MAAQITNPTASGYTPDPDLQIHDNAIRLLCQPFLSHENGLPEWIKNAADEYARRDDQEERRIIVVILQNAHRDRLASISCLDFCGISSSVIDKEFRHWGDPEAATRGSTKTASIQGGHGNGGKCYMAQMFKDRAFLHSVTAGSGSRYGTVGGAVRFGYFPDPKNGKNYAVSDTRAELSSALEALGVKIAALPGAAEAALAGGDGFTLVSGLDPQGYDGRIPARHLVDSLEDHPQMAATLDLCDVYVIANGKLLNEGHPLRLRDISPMPGGEIPRVVPMPENLIDPLSGESVSTTEGGALPQGELILKTSDVSMRWSRKSRHVITYRARSGFIGWKSVTEFDVQSSYRDRIYGNCTLAALEPYKQNLRAELADGPVTRAVEAWISREIEEYGRVFEARDRRRHTEEEKHAVAEMNEALNRWKNELLSTVLVAGGDNGTGPPPPPPPLPSGVPARLELSLTYARAGIGVPLRPTVRFYDKAGRRIRPTAVSWTSSDPNVAWVDEGFGVINTFREGVATIQAETLDGMVKSNTAEIDVVLIREITLEPAAIDVPAGSRRSITAVCRLVSGEEASDVLLLWQEGNSEVARVSSSGAVYGFQIGSTDVTAMDDRCIATNTVSVSVVESSGKGGDGDSGTRRGHPLVLISEYQPDPDTGEDVVLSGDDPPVHQRPQDADRNIWWINSAAPLARLYLTSESYGYESREWRIYHTERLIDVIVQIMLTHGPASEDTLAPGEWIGRWGQTASDVQIAAARGLAKFLASGELPT